MALAADRNLTSIGQLSARRFVNMLCKKALQAGLAGDLRTA